MVPLRSLQDLHVGKRIEERARAASSCPKAEWAQHLDVDQARRGEADEGWLLVSGQILRAVVII